MTTVTMKDLHSYLQCGDPEERDYELMKLMGPEMSQETFDYIDANQDKFLHICSGTEMSGYGIGGNDIIEFVRAALEATEEGYKVVTWCGPKTEALIVGIKGDFELKE